MMRESVEEMTVDELRFLARKQAELISAYEKMVFMKDELIRNLESVYRSRIGMEEARIEYDVKMAAIRETHDMIYSRLNGLAVERCEAQKDGDGDV